MSLLFQTIGYTLALTAPVAAVAWLVLWFPLSKRKRQYMSDAELDGVRTGRDTSAMFRLAFGYSAEMLTDPIIRRLRRWSRIALLWPFGVFAILVVIFNLFPVSSGV